MATTLSRLSGRLSKADRRSQLLDVAADLVLTGGTGAVTMERLAERAGVSKPLVYLHFDNAAAVLVELYLREVTQLGAEILAAVDGPSTPEARLRAGVHRYFDVVHDRGALFTLLAAAASSTVVDQTDDGSRLGQRFVADLFQQVFALPVRRARVASAMFLGALDGGVEAWSAGELRRTEVEEAAVSVALHLASPE